MRGVTYGLGQIVRPPKRGSDVFVRKSVGRDGRRDGDIASGFRMLVHIREGDGNAFISRHHNTT